jgi:flagellar biosynthesis protein
MSDKERGSASRAAALRYEQGETQAPALVAKGRGLVAERILEIAREHGIPIHRDPALVDVLSRLDIDQQIPPQLYLVVAEILAFIYRAQQARVDAGRAPLEPGTRG